MTDGFIPPHGGYQDLFSYQKAEIVYDGTVRFCERFLSKRDRTYDQMIQAGYCSNELECDWKRAHDSYYCGGHYSWEVIFQKTY